MKVLAIDPGTTKSGVIIWDGITVIFAGKLENSKVTDMIWAFSRANHEGEMVIEQIRSYGQPVGQEVFDTCVWCGRFDQTWQHVSLKEAVYIPRIEVKKHICHRHIAKDAEIRRALIDRFGDKPTKAKPNPIYGDHKLKADEWQAFALAVTWFDKNKK